MMPLGLVCVLKIPPGNGKHGWMGTSQCGSAAGLGAGVWVQVQCGILLEVDGRWWADRRYSNHRILMPLGVVCGENSSRQWETWLDRHIQMWQCSRAQSRCVGVGAVWSIARG